MKIWTPRRDKDDKRTDKLAATILEREHGIDHKPGERDDLCPRCKEKQDEGP